MSCYPLPAASVLRPDFLPKYESIMRTFYSEIVQLNTTLYIVKRIVDFPVHLFGDGRENVFFYVSVLNGIETIVGITYKLLVDTDRRAYSLLRLKRELLSGIVSEHRDRYSQHLRAAKVERTVRELLVKADALRSNQIAHLNEALATGELSLQRLNIEELESIKTEINRVYTCLSFFTESIFVPLSYAEGVQRPSGSASGPDIERVLDLIAFNSNLLNMPERDPTTWLYTKGRFLIEDQRHILQYRRRANLREIDFEQSQG